MRDAFDTLERQLREATRATRAGAAPAGDADAEAGAGAASPAPPLRRRRRWHRSGPLAVAAALVLSGGAVAAVTSLLPIGEPVDEPGFPVDARPDAGAGVRAGDARILPLRVADPAGGPPWGLRVFASTRGMSCVQAGRVYRGRFGVVRASRTEPSRVAFRELRALPGANSLCSGASRGGFPVVRGLRRVEIEGGATDPRRCGGAECPITGVRLLRFGLLGPAARSAAFVDGDGTRGPAMALDPASGGAYLFVVPRDPAAYRRAEEAQRAAGEAWQRAYREGRRRGLSAREAGRRASRRTPRTRFVVPAAERRPRDGVVARFAGGRTLRVAGRGRYAGALPGVARGRGRLPDARARLGVVWRGSGATRGMTVRFAAPVRVDRADRGYRMRVRGPDGARCDRRLGGFQATTRDLRRGAPVRFDVGVVSGYGRRTWCPGRFTVRVTYAAGGREALVGQVAFTVPR